MKLSPRWIIRQTTSRLPNRPKQRLMKTPGRRLKSPLPDVSKYDTIYIGSPIWWGQYPMIMFTFFDKENLNGKTIIPFTTHAGSGLANTVEALK
ncbi:flavodoxin [Limosilactobacillus fermentum]